MEHQCHQCNSAVEDGLPFCPRCGAPQIRVLEDEGNEPATGPMPPGTPGELQPPAQPVFGGPVWTPAPSRDPNQIQWRLALPGAAMIGLLGGVVFLFAGRIPFLFFLVPVLCGALMVRVYRRRTHAVVRPFAGAKIGAFAGLFGFLPSVLGVVSMFTISRNTIQQSMREAMEHSSRTMDPQSKEMLQGMVDKLNTPEGLAMFAVLILVIIFGILLVGTAMGGALAASLFGKEPSNV